MAGGGQQGEGNLLNVKHMHSHPEIFWGSPSWASALRDRRKVRADLNLAMHHKTTETPQKFQRGTF